MNKKILFFDIDGTLLGHGEYLPESAVEGIKKTQEKGNLCFLCSGRSPAMLPKIITDMGFDGIICGGGTHISIGSDIITEFVLNPEELSRIIKWLDNSDLELLLEGVDYVYVLELSRYSDASRLKAIINNLSSPLREIRNSDLSKVKIGKFSGAISPLQWDYALRMAKDISDFMAVIIHRKPDEEKYECSPDEINWSGYGFMEFLPVGYNKAVAIEKVLRKLNIPITDTYAFGDSENDREMLTLVPHSICMGNGSDAIKEIASYTAPALSDDGIYKALKHFSLL